MSRMLFLRDIDVDVMMRCRACGHEGTLPRADLERRFGPGYPVLSLAPHFRCSKCNSRDVESRPLPTPDGPALETMVDKAATAAVEDRFHSTLAALRGLVDAAHGTDDTDGAGDRPAARRPPPAKTPPKAPAPGAAEPPPPLGSMMDALRGLTGGEDEAGGHEEEGDGDDGDEGAPVIPLSRESHALQPPPFAQPFAPRKPAAPPQAQEADGADDFLKELQRISRLMGDDDPPPSPPAPPAAAAAGEDDDEDWLPALFRDDPPPASSAPLPHPPVDEEEEDAAAFGLTGPVADEPVPADDPADWDGDWDTVEPEEEPPAAPPPPAHLTDTLAALRSMIQSAAKDEVPEGEGDDRPAPPPARPDFGYHGDDDDDAADPPEPAFGRPAAPSAPATGQDLSALKAMVEKAERDADRSTSAADIASVIPPDFRPPFWVEAGLDRAPAPAPAPVPPPAAPPAAAAPVRPPEPPPPAPPPEAPRRKGSFLSRLRRRRADDTHHEAPAEPPPVPAPVPVPAPPPRAAAPASVPPPPDTPEPSDETLDQRLAALKALLAGAEAASVSAPPAPAPRIPEAKDGADDDDILDLDAFADDEPPAVPPPPPMDEDFRRILFNRLEEEREHPHHPYQVPAEDKPPAEDDIPLEDILSFTSRTRGREEPPPAKPAFSIGDKEPPRADEPEAEPGPADFGRFAIRDPDVLFARSHDEDDGEPPPSYLWDDPADSEAGPEPAQPAPPESGSDAPFPFMIRDRETGTPPPPKAAELKPAAAASGGPRPDAESYARTLAALRGILGAQGSDGGDTGAPAPRGGGRRRKKSI